MKKALIVYAHEEPKSFNSALKDTAVAALRESGCDVTVSDLYAISFNPVGGKHDFTRLSNPDFFKYAAEQTKATETDSFVREVQAEQDKLFAADFLLFQFPLWWFGLPAILKGWVDRVFAAGLTYGGGRFYDNGALKGRRAMCSLTTGGPATMYAADGLNGDMEQILFPINHGMFYFVGFDVLEPAIAYGAAHVGDDQRAKYLADLRTRLLNWQSAPTIPFRPLEDYEPGTFQLKK